MESKNINQSQKKYRGIRCTQATLRAFKIEGCPLHGIGVLDAIAKIYSHKFIDNAIGMKLADFIDDYADKGNFVISTSGHSMALVDGILIDTAHGTGRRKIQYAFEVK